ncbi:unnamed protein product [Owenia fusiformis]|uniref:tRNA-uridine aminocarboxypropyltransferase 1 n=1 Tax=Owenia fusiformis TaxID=6347 RepID=A0A8S4N361_OWEFU|nr:unnamed protein product [Owenia fusiformis]
MEENPFPGLKISDSAGLHSVEGRLKCKKCGQSRKYYCYSCCIPLEETKGMIPTVQLPVKVEIIKHRNEIDGKSTAVHAAVVAPEHCTIHTYPCIPDYDKSKTLLVFPCKESLTFEQLIKQCAPLHKDDSTIQDTEASDEIKEPPYKVIKTDIATDKTQCAGIGDKYTSPYDTVVFIDSTWNQTKKIYNDERLKGLQCIELKSRETKFWRHQKDKPRTYLATIEAIYYFLLEYHQSFVPSEYIGQYDDLLFFFVFMYGKIKELYDGGKQLKAYSSPETDKNKAEEKC